jgi:hypothetical protein
MPSSSNYRANEAYDTQWIYGAKKFFVGANIVAVRFSVRATSTNATDVQTEVRITRTIIRTRYAACMLRTVRGALTASVKVNEASFRLLNLASNKILVQEMNNNLADPYCQ